MLEPFDLRNPWVPVQSDAVVAKVFYHRWGREKDLRAAAADAIAEEYAGVVAAVRVSRILMTSFPARAGGGGGVASLATKGVP